MKRSESILVYAVTAVLAVILVVAIGFGGEGAGSAGGAPAGGDDVASRLLADSGSASPGSFVAGGEGVRGEGAAPPPANAGDPPGGGDPGATPGGAAPDGPAFGPLRRGAGDGSLVAVLGEFRVEAAFDGARYRVAIVRPGDTFSALVQRFTAGTVPVEQVLALNEWIADPRSIRAGDEVRFPLVDEALLVEAAAARAARATPAAGGTAAGPGEPAERPRDPGPAPAVAAGAAPATGEVHVVQPGEALWMIAERRVGARRAKGYVEAIVAANPSLPSADRVRAGQRLVLPPVE